MAVDYKKIGLVNTKDMFARAIKGGWAVPAFNSITWSSFRLSSRLLLT